MHRSLAACLLALVTLAAGAQPAEDRVILQAREAARIDDRGALASFRDQAAQARHPLASWVDYWEIGARLKDAQQPELEAFYARWPGSYVEDRLRNDWLLVLGQRRDWVNFRREHPRFRMADDREVDCYALLIRHLEGEEVRGPAQQAWMAQRRDDEGCKLMARTLAEAGQFGAAQIWPMVRLGAETQRLASARAAAALLDKAGQAAALDALENPARWLARHSRGTARGTPGEAAVVALLRMAVSDPEVAAAQADEWEHRLTASDAAYVWAGIGRRAAMRLLPSAAGHYVRAFRRVPEGQTVDWPADTLEWGVRAALRADERQRWPLVLRATEAMAPQHQFDSAWVYWRARALQLLSLGLRSEGVREWNFTLRDLAGDRALLAAAQWACEREVWDRCINTSERTRGEVSLAQRYPTPFRDQVLAKAREAALDPAYVYGLIRQESRFILDARSGVGASGLMQLMPATARWTARKIGLPYTPDMINDRDVNLRLGTAYLKLMLDDFEGVQPLAIAGYNAGPNRPRRWRDGPLLEPAAWIENIPFDETRDYVKKVLANAVHYAAVLGVDGQSLKAHLGPAIGPRAERATQPDKDLP
jgi:soluble lytic murein transglycosylase